MNKSAKRSGALAGALLYALAAPALAQDTSDDADSKKKKSDAEAAVQTLPTWDSYGPSDAETQEETFFRLSRDFVTMSDLSIDRLGAVPIWPRGELKILGVRLLPYLREAVQWDANYYKQPQSGPAANRFGRDAQWTHVNQAGVLGDAVLMGGRLKIATSIESTWNQRYGPSAAPDTWDFDGQIGATYRALSGAWASIGYTYTETHDFADLPTLTRDFGRSRKGAFVRWGFDRDIFFGTKLKFEFGVTTTDHVAEDPAFNALDRRETSVYGKVSYPFFKNTTEIFVLATQRFNNRYSDRINDGNSFGVNVGIQGSIPLSSGQYRAIRGQVSVGFDSSLYDDDTYTSGSQTLIADDSGRRSSHANIVAALQYVMSPRSTADLRYIHGTQFSFFGNYQVVDHVQFTFSHSFTRQLTGRVQAFYEHTNPSGQMPNKTIPPTSLRAKSANNVNREGAGVGLRYAVNDWMDVDLNLSVENRNDHTVNSFKNYQGVLGFTFYLNALIPKTRTPVVR